MTRSTDPVPAGPAPARGGSSASLDRRRGGADLRPELGRPTSSAGDARAPGTAAADPRPPRVVISDVEPEIDGGRHAVKRVTGEELEVRLKAYAEGHDQLRGVLLHRREGEDPWTEEPLERLPNDAWVGRYAVGAPGYEEYGIEVWVDDFATWRAGLTKKIEAGLDVTVELTEGAELIRRGAERATGHDHRWLLDCAEMLTERAPIRNAPVVGNAPAPDRSAASSASHDDDLVLRLAQSETLASTMARHVDRHRATRYAPGLRVQVERERGRRGAWYEFFPRSCTDDPARHGTLRDCEERLAHASRMGFEVVYLPPIHPIGHAHRKGPNNAAEPGPDDPGSPWAIGAESGGHMAVHPDLGTLEDFDRLVDRARAQGLEVALDLAFQCSPDHPWVREHPEWFRHRPDGSIHYAENPPKKYHDIYPLHFECDDWRGLWQALQEVVRFWIAHGVTIFRVDNPHTKPFAFWEWLIREIRCDHPETVWLSEAFTRPSILQHLAKIGFSQSYTYFTWRNRRRELEDYVEELWSPPISEYLRPNFFANTPDILHEYLQLGGRAAFATRLVLAASLADSYGIYGPPFELCVADAVPGTEEYLDSEKYQVRSWRFEGTDHIVALVTRMNRIRRECSALGRGGPPVFLDVDNEMLIAFTRTARDGSSSALVVVNLDPHHAQSGWVDVPAELVEAGASASFQVEDLLGGDRHLWHAGRNYVLLDPTATPAHVFLVRQRVHSENDFDYFL